MIGSLARFLSVRAMAWAVGGALVLAAGSCAHATLTKRELASMTADRDAQRAAAVAWARSAQGWQKSFRESEALRGRETAAARLASSQAAQACAARVATAQRSARAIQSIVTKEVPRDPQGCPVRGIVRAGELRDALAPGS